MAKTKFATPQEEIDYLVSQTNFEPRTEFAYQIPIEELDPESAIFRDENQPSPEQELDRKENEKERLDGIRKVLADLDEREKLVINAIFFEEKSQKQIAIETGWPRRTVNWIFNQALLKLENNPIIREIWDETLDRTYPKGSHREPGAE